MIDGTVRVTRPDSHLTIRHYYHVYAAGGWVQPVREHMRALSEARLRDMHTIAGIVGPERDRKLARDGLSWYTSGFGLCRPERYVEADEGWEQVTLQAIYQDVHETPGEYLVLYCHTKGAHRDTPGNTDWRRAMTSALVGRWRDCTALLEGGEFDAVGCHWIRAPEWPEQVPFFAGNFFWAKASYLRTLPEPPNETRWQPEVWVSGDGTARVYDMLPGYPSYGIA